MRTPRLKTPSPALVVATVALFVAVGGSAYAASQIGTNQIKDKAVKTSKLGSKAVTGGKIAGQAVKRGKIKNSAVNANKLSNPIYWAYVSGGTNPSLIRDSGADSVSFQSLGHWKVTFGKPVDECSYQVTSAHLELGRELSAADESENVVSVKVRDSAGNLTNAGSQFSLEVNC